MFWHWAAEGRQTPQPHLDQGAGRVRHGDTTRVRYSATGVTPAGLHGLTSGHARQLNAFIRDNGYDAVVCSHLFPMETLTFLRRERCEVKMLRHPLVRHAPVAARFLAPMDKAARAALGLPADKKIYLIMTGGIGCGDAVSLCDAIRRVPDENALLCVLPGRNEALRQALGDCCHGQGVLTVLFTDQVPALYARGRRAAE